MFSKPRYDATILKIYTKMFAVSMTSVRPKLQSYWRSQSYNIIHLILIHGQAKLDFNDLSSQNIFIVITLLIFVTSRHVWFVLANLKHPSNIHNSETNTPYHRNKYRPKVTRQSLKHKTPVQRGCSPTIQFQLSKNC